MSCILPYFSSQPSSSLTVLYIYFLSYSLKFKSNENDTLLFCLHLTSMPGAYVLDQCLMYSGVFESWKKQGSS